MTERVGKRPLYCPYYDEELMKADLRYCQACGLTIFYCPRCRKPLPRENEVCPHCGADIRPEAIKED
jgi:predicted amidophosphoribosyltransferase